MTVTSQIPSRHEIEWVADQATKSGRDIIASALRWASTGLLAAEGDGPFAAGTWLKQQHEAFMAAQPDPHRWSDADAYIRVHKGVIVPPPEAPHPPDDPGMTMVPFPLTHTPDLRLSEEPGRDPDWPATETPDPDWPATLKTPERKLPRYFRA